MFMSGDYGGQWKCLNSEECSWSPSVAFLDLWGVALSCLNSPSPPECTMDMNGCKRSDRMLMYLSESYQGPISCQLHTPHTIAEPPPA
ncbi:uncharacterized protein TNCV_549551 [Trichonephila clavipes]|nr:uncharacterized protein TNCV_549551 [Trichonephila clavipes]